MHCSVFRSSSTTADISYRCNVELISRRHSSVAPWSRTPPPLPIFIHTRRSPCSPVQGREMDKTMTGRWAGTMLHGASHRKDCQYHKYLSTEAAAARPMVMSESSKRYIEYLLRLGGVFYNSRHAPRGQARGMGGDLCSVVHE